MQIVAKPTMVTQSSAQNPAHSPIDTFIDLGTMGAPVEARIILRNQPA
jgi:hypothetical protein